MSDKAMEIIIESVILAVLLLTGYIMPDAVRKEICFGVRIPYDKVNSELVKNEKAQYKRRYITSCGIYILAVIAIMWNFYTQQIFVGGLVVFLIISFTNYLISYRNMKKIKELLGNDERKEYVVIDTDFRSTGHKMLVSPLWFIIPVIVSAIDYIAGYMFYKKLPEKIAVHWNALGMADSFTVKSFKSVFQMPTNILILTIIFYIIYRLIKRAKQQINIRDSKESIERNIRFRLISSAYLVVINIGMSIINTINYFSLLGILNTGVKIYQVVSVLFIVILLLSPLLLVLFVGQGGSRLNIKKKKQNDKNDEDRDDNRFWKLGAFYFNPNDPSIMVEKRFGVGWTINFGNAKAVIAFIVLLAVIIISSRIMGH